MKWFSVRNPLTQDDVVRIEKDLGVIFPEDYKKMIGPINGGALRNAYIEHPNEGHIAYSRNVPLNRESRGNIFVLFEALQEENLQLIPFGSVGNGDYFCFDPTNNDVVVLWEHESGDYINVCNSFSQLMGMLKGE